MQSRMTAPDAHPLSFSPSLSLRPSLPPTLSLCLCLSLPLSLPLSLHPCCPSAPSRDGTRIQRLMRGALFKPLCTVVRYRRQPARDGRRARKATRGNADPFGRRLGRHRSFRPSPLSRRRLPRPRVGPSAARAAAAQGETADGEARGRKGLPPMRAPTHNSICPVGGPLLHIGARVLFRMRGRRKYIRITPRRQLSSKGRPVYICRQVDRGGGGGGTASPHLPRRS